MKFKLNEDLSIYCVANDDYVEASGETWVKATDSQAKLALSLDNKTELWQWKNNDVVESEYRQEILDDIFNSQQSDLRKQAYPLFSDPVFFQYQIGQKTEQDWLAAIQRVKNMYPYRGE